MIDPHVHLRDFNEAHKETLFHGLSVANKAGLDAVFEMPNTNPPLISRDVILRRIAFADAVQSPVFHGLYCGLTKDTTQIRESIAIASDLFPRVVGLKLFAGISTGTLAVENPGEQESVFEELSTNGYNGVLSVHCEKVSRFKNDLANDTDPFSHTLTRPPESETESVSDIIGFAEKTRFAGTLHICHISVPESVEEVEHAKKRNKIRLVCGITPHHSLMWDELMKHTDGFLLRMNPPLRPKAFQVKMLDLLLEGKIDWIETDHAPHTIVEKKTASGIPVIPFYPHFLKIIREMGMSESRLHDVTHSAIEAAFNIRITERMKSPDFELENEYEFDPFKAFR